MIEPFFQSKDGYFKLYHGDCFEIIKAMDEVLNGNRYICNELPDLLNEEILKALGLWLGAIAVVTLFAYLMVNYQSSVAAKEAVVFLSTGRFSVVFYLGVVVLGIVIPLAILVPAYFGEVKLFLLAVAGISELAGSFVLRYSLLRAGIYPPIS